MNTAEVLQAAAGRGAVLEYATYEGGRAALHVLPSTAIEGPQNRLFRDSIRACQTVLLVLLDPDEADVLTFVQERLLDYLYEYPGVSRLELQEAICPECGGGWWLPRTCPYPRPADWDETPHRTGSLHALAAIALLEVEGLIRCEGDAYYPMPVEELRRAA